jgi:hypothetical protein
LEKALLYKPEDRLSISGMKYLTDVFMLKHKNSNGGVNTSGFSQPPRAPDTRRPPMPHDEGKPSRQSYMNVDSDRPKPKMVSRIMYT